MECIPCLISRLIQSLVGGPAQLLDGPPGLFAKLRRRFRKCLLSSQNAPPKCGNGFPVLPLAENIVHVGFHRGLRGGRAA